MEADEYEFFESGTEVRVEKRIDEKGNMFLGAVESINADTKHRSIIG